ncbi:MAG: glutamine amidotransferase [Proteobacteria bacterium]|nr:glutamine amidotransferase [Pseudomonadota bacterium]
MARLTIIKTGAPPARVRERRGDFHHWFAGAVGIGESDVTVVDVAQGEPLPEPISSRGVIVTGSPALLTDRKAWSVRTGLWLEEVLAADIALLGVCYGHQLLADVLGGKVRDNPNGRQIGTIDVLLTDHGRRCALLGCLPETAHVPASHTQAVTELPRDAQRLAVSSLDPNHAFAYGTRAWGVQFHPEFDADIVRGYISAREREIEAEGIDPDALRRDARDTDHGRRLLARFGQLLDVLGGSNGPDR